MSTGAVTQKHSGGGGALERGHRASLECLAQLGDALGGVGAFSKLEAAQHVVGQAVSMTKEECQWALARKQPLWGGGALEGGDLCLLDNASECRGAFVSDDGVI